MQDAGRSASGAGPGPAAAGVGVGPPRLTVIAGEARRVGDKLFLDSEGKVSPVRASSNARITRDGEKVKLDEIKVGDWVVMALGHDGTAQKLDAMSEIKSNAPAGAGGTEWARATALIVPLLVKAFIKTRGGGDKTDKDRQKNKNKKRSSHPLLRRKPSH